MFLLKRYSAGQRFVAVTVNGEWLVENTFCLKNYGCQMNVYDSQVAKSLIRGLGFREVEDPKEAALVILNTCYIRDKASEKIFSELGALNAMQRKQGRKPIIAVVGCVAQAEGDNILSRAPYVDIVLGPQSLHKLPEMVKRAVAGKGKSVVLDFEPELKFDYLKEELVATGKVSAFVSVQEGCDKFCTFCVVPYTRGAEYSRPAASIYQEVKRLVKSGVKEVTLLGQNVSAYHGDYQGKEISLGYLLELVSEIDGLERIRYTTSHPLDMHEELYQSHAYNPKVMPFINLPVQSGSDAVLKRMNRKHKARDYLDIVDKMRSVREDVAFSSDFIVGFAGESDEDFEATLDLIQKVRFIHGYSFKYSIRPGTPGAEYKDQVEEEVKASRLKRLQQLLQQQQLEYNRSFEGKTVWVLFDRLNERKQALGRSQYMQVVGVDNPNCYGRLLKVKVVAGNQNSLVGEPILNAIAEVPAV